MVKTLEECFLSFLNPPLTNTIGPALIELPSSTRHFDYFSTFRRQIEHNPFFLPIVLTIYQSQILVPTASPLQGSSLPLMGPLSLTQPPIPSQPSTSGLSSTLAPHYFLLTTHMWTLSALLGHPILPPRNVMSSETTSVPVTSGLFLLSTNQTSNALAVT